jgi:predicted adenine nucleotide alpha hydrolase (AANH) superfamily ATPase
MPADPVPSAGSEASSETSSEAGSVESSVLLHVCCGPCSLLPAIRLREEGFAVTGLFYNPNIHPLAEYLRRREAAGLAGARLGMPVLEAETPEAAWDVARWLANVHDPVLVPALAKDPRGPERCAFCYRERLLYTARRARAGGFAAFTTSLLYSRHQRHDTIRQEGERAAETEGVPFLYRDFRPDWQAGIDLSKEWNLYRQNYCACIYSEAERFGKKLRAAHAAGLAAHFYTKNT